MSSLSCRQQRVVSEKADLDARLSKLRAFLESPRLEEVSGVERHLLSRQEWLMSELSLTLAARIREFSK